MLLHVRSSSNLRTFADLLRTVLLSVVKMLLQTSPASSKLNLKLNDESYHSYECLTLHEFPITISFSVPCWIIFQGFIKPNVWPEGEVQVFRLASTNSTTLDTVHPNLTETSKFPLGFLNQKYNEAIVCRALNSGRNSQLIFHNALRLSKWTKSAKTKIRHQ